MSRHDIDVPIFALTPNVSTARRLALYRNVRPLLHFQVHTDRDESLAAAERLLLEKGTGPTWRSDCADGRGTDGATRRHQCAKDCQSR